MYSLYDFVDVAKFDDIESVFESEAPHTKKIMAYLYDKVESVLKTNKGSNDFKILVGKYIDRNSSKLYTLGPQYLIPFTDNDKEGYFKLFNINQKELKAVIKEVTKSINKDSNFIYLNNNPIFFIFYCCIRYYHLKVDKKGINSALAIYALSVYPSVFTSSFPYEPNPQVMEYTINRLSKKFFIKEAGNIFTALIMSITTAYDTLKKDMLDPSDGDVIKFVDRVHTSQKLLIRKICDEYMKDWRSNNRISDNLESSDEMVIDSNKENNSSVVDTVTNKVFIPIISNGINLQYISAASKAAGVSMSDLQYYVSKILVDKYKTDIRDFIHSVLFRFLYDEGHKASDINSSAWLTFSAKLFKQTNSNDPNISTIKRLLEKWASATGIYTKFKREASRSNYKKAIFLYFIFIIQYYNNIN